jgi:hypothetical protein
VDGPRGPRTYVDLGNPFWRVIWRMGYVVVRRSGRLVRLFVVIGAPGYDNEIVELRLVGRRSGRPRPVLLTLIRFDGAWYVGHPNGPRAWLANLAAADSVVMSLPKSGSVRVRGVALRLGRERDAVIRQTAFQQPWPGSMLYRAAQRHILRAGIYYRLERLEALERAPP